MNNDKVKAQALTYAIEMSKLPAVSFRRHIEKAYLDGYGAGVQDTNPPLPRPKMPWQPPNKEPKHATWAIIIMDDGGVKIGRWDSQLLCFEPRFECTVAEMIFMGEIDRWIPVEEILKSY